MCLYCEMPLAEPVVTPNTALPYLPMFTPQDLQFASLGTQAKAAVELITVGTPDKALTQLEETPPAAKGKAQSDLSLLKAIALITGKKANEAGKVLTRLISEHPSNSDAIYLLSLVRAAEGDLLKAESLLEESLWFSRYVVVPKAMAQAELAHLYRHQNKGEKARQLINKSLQDNPGNLQLLIELAELEFETGNKDPALTAARKAIATSPDNPRANLLLAKGLLVNLNKRNPQAACEESKSASDKALASPHLSDDGKKAAQLVKTKALLCSGDTKTAEQLAKRLKKAYPNDLEVERLQRQVSIEKEGIASAQPEIESESDES